MDRSGRICNISRNVALLLGTNAIGLAADCHFPERLSRWSCDDCATNSRFSPDSVVHVVDLRAGCCRHRTKSGAQDRSTEASWSNSKRRRSFSDDDGDPDPPRNVQISDQALVFAACLLLHNLGLLDTHQTGSKFPDCFRDLHWFLFG